MSQQQLHDDKTIQLALQYPSSERSLSPDNYPSPPPPTPRPELKLDTDYPSLLPPSPSSVSSFDSPLDTPSTAEPSPIYPTSRSFSIPFNPKPITSPTLPYPVSPSYRETQFSPSAPCHPSILVQSPSSSSSLDATSPSSLGRNSIGGADSGPRVQIPHPYARMYAKQDAGSNGKRRRMWNHALEKMVFKPRELSTLTAPQRRKIYTATLEAHVDRLHKKLDAMGLFPVPADELDRYYGLNSKMVKSMVSGLQKDWTDMNVKMLELDRSISSLQSCVTQAQMMSAPSRASYYQSSSMTGDAQVRLQRRHSDSNISTFQHPNYFSRCE
ncbi:hypothetical protein C8Q75DRAFT_768980 [Abortiporus biennis]|nr:hypothetical protein C8Q75DRAFT_768980 [Abortiporus biennis]